MPNSPPTTHRISEFHKWEKEHVLDLAPPWQRKPVWSPKNKSYLIDTILNQFPVPEVYVQVKTDHEGNTRFVVVDGQQRIRAILEYIEGEYALDEEESPAFANKEFKDLPSGVRHDFWDYPIVTRELDEKTEIKEVFRRLNKYVVALNEQELRNATYGGHFIKMVNDIASEDTFWEDYRIFRANEIRRMYDAEFISELLIGMLNGIQQKNEADIDGFYKKYDQSFPERDALRRNFNATERLIQDIFKDDFVQTRWRGKPDFYSLFLAFCDLSEGYFFPLDRYAEMKRRLIEFASHVDKHVRLSEKEKEKSNPLVRDYAEQIEKRSTHKSSRKRRYDIVRELLIPYLIARDTRRDFNDEERRIAWNNAKNKICPICHTEVTWENYNLDHVVAYSKGGKTELRNSQITHKVCNIKKSNKTS
jgi:5-methylcytosine-specific restriction endonuclease McrA